MLSTFSIFDAGFNTLYTLNLHINNIHVFNCNEHLFWIRKLYFSSLKYVSKQSKLQNDKVPFTLTDNIF